MLNDIPIRQNEDPQIQRLAAQRELYSKAKRLINLQFVIAGPVTLAVGLATMLLSELALPGAVWALVILLAIHLYMDPKQQRLRKQAAAIQEAFDCDVLSMPWRCTRAADQPDVETVVNAARDYWKRAKPRAALMDWYPAPAGELPLFLARLVCQRENCWWDAELRRSYRLFWVFVLIGLSVLQLVLGSLLGLTVVDWIVRGLLPLAPLLDLGGREYRAQQDAADRAGELKRCSRHFWDAALDGQAVAKSEADSRELQDAIFAHRAGTQPVPDLVYRRLRDRFQTGMTEGAAELVAQAQARLGLHGSGANRP